MPALPSPRRVVAAVSLVSTFVFALTVGACRDRNSSARDETNQVMSAKLGAPEVAPSEGFAAGRRVAAQAQDAADLQSAAVATVASAPRVPRAPQVSAQPASPSMIIRNGYVSIEVDSVARSIDAVRALAASLGGYIGNVEMSTGDHQVHSATMEVKVPAPRFDDAMAGVRPLGKVERSNATAEDVGEEFVDVSARIANGKRLEERLVRLLETRTGKLVDVLAIERELARIREEIERQEGRIRYLSAHIALSTIAVTVHEKAPLVATTPGSNALRTALIGMWRNMVHVVAFGIEALGVIIPPLAIAGIAWLIWRRARRRSVPVLNPEPTV